MLFPHFPALTIAVPNHLLRPNIDTSLFNTCVSTVKYMSNHKKLEVKYQAKADTTLFSMELAVSGGDRLIIYHANGYIIARATEGNT